MTARILVVEDDPHLARNIERAMRPHFDHVVVAGTATEAQAVHALHHDDIDIAIVDVSLPDGNGLELIELMREVDPSLGAVVATGADDPATAAGAIALGVQGYLLKPFRMSELHINVSNARRWRELDQRARAHEAHLSGLVERRTRELEISRFETIHRLSLAAEFRDPETGNHLERMSSFAAVLAKRIGLDTEDCEEIRLASPMHDVGKIAIPDQVLNHSGPFDAAQRRIMNQHTVIGYRILSGSSSSLLETAALIARSHHEWFDGSGYPFNLAGDDIPLVGRIVAIADVFDALTTRRRYKPALSVEKSLDMMYAERGTHFDPALLDVFAASLDEVLFIREAYSGSPLSDLAATA